MDLQVDLDMIGYEYPVSDSVVLKMCDARTIKNNYAAMLYFCQRIIGREDISLIDLKQFEMQRWHCWQSFVANASWPVDAYLKRIHELEDKAAGGEHDRNRGEW